MIRLNIKKFLSVLFSTVFCLSFNQIGHTQTLQDFATGAGEPPRLIVWTPAINSNMAANLARINTNLTLAQKEETTWSALGLPQIYRLDLDKMTLELEETKLETLGRALALPLMGKLHADRGATPEAIGVGGAMIWAGDAWMLSPDALEGLGLSVANDVPLIGGLSLRPRFDMMVGSYGQMLGGVGGGLTLHFTY